MKINTKVIDTLSNKRNKLNKLKKHLNKKFVGLENIIDDVINSITPYYVFPDSINRPIVINLWGMTGTGKTSLVEEIVKFLKLEHSFLKFDIGEYCDSGNELKNELSGKISNIDGKNSVILFDEFQLGRTINENGDELDRNSLRPVWELIDSGIINTYNSKVFYGLSELIQKLKKCIDLGVETDKDGFIVKKADIYDSLFKDDYGYRPCDFKECYIETEFDDYDEEDESDMATFDMGDIEEDLKIEKSKDKYVSKTSTKRYWSSTVSEKLKYPRFIKKDMFDDLLYPCIPSKFKNIKNFSLHETMFNKSLNELLNFLTKEFLEKVQLMKKVDFSKSLIFCLGNLDELYHGDSHNVSPDEDADSFHKSSLDITLPQVKMALSKRFRMEQIARLGNTHYIYPTLNIKSYKKLISNYLKSKSKSIKKEFKLDITFHKTVNDILYSEGVYPSQGIRPLLSSFNSMIDSYVTKVITDIILDNSHDKVTKVKWEYINDKYKIYNDDISYSYQVDAKLQKLRTSDNSHIQSMVAVHESGHALISCLEFNIAPTEVLSKTADMSEGVCKHDFKDMVFTKDFLIKEIKVLLAGLRAEKLIFGDMLCSIGATSDLQKATQFASDIVKTYGLGEHTGMLSSDMEASMTTTYVKFDNNLLEEEVYDIIEDCKIDVDNMLAENEKYLLKLSKSLVKKTKIETDEIKDILKGLKIKWIEPKDAYDFKGILKKKIKASL